MKLTHKNQSLKADYYITKKPIRTNLFLKSFTGKKELEIQVSGCEKIVK